MGASLDDLLSMATFARVVETKSFTAAADRLGVAKSVVSARIARLEDRLGAKLLHRTTRRLSLTEAGATLYRRCARIVAEADDAATVIEGESTEAHGILRVSAPPAFAELHLSPSIAELLRAHPAVQVELSVNDRMVDLAFEGFDLAIRITSAGDSQLVGRKLGVARNVVCGSPSYLDAHGTPQVPADLVGHHCLHYANLDPCDEWRFTGKQGPFSIPITPRFTGSSGRTLAAAAVAGVGLAVLPSFMIARELAEGLLRVVLPDHPLPELVIYALHPHGRHPPAKVRVFVDLLVSRFRRRFV